MEKIKVIGFDADDTLWINEPLYQKAEKQFCALLEDFLPQSALSRELLKIEIKNIPLYGYGAKSFMLSMIETAIHISNQSVELEVIEKIINIGKELIDSPVVLIAGVTDILEQLNGDYKLVVLTKGDILDQEKKLKKSGLAHYFHHIEVMSGKNEGEYRRILKHLDINPANFLMIGNSLKSDIIPILNIGGHAIHIPYHTTWEYERIDITIDNPKFRQVEGIVEVLGYLK